MPSLFYSFVIQSSVTAMGASYLLSLEKLINCEVMAKLRFNIYKPKSIVAMKLPDVQQPCTEVPGLFLWQEQTHLIVWPSGEV